MDTNDLLAGAREAYERYRASADGSEAETEAAQDLILMFNALDEDLSTGATPPKDWVWPKEP